MLRVTSVCVIGIVACTLVSIVHGAPKAEAVAYAQPVAEPCCGRGASFIKGAIVGAAISRLRNRGGGGYGGGYYGGGGYSGGGGGYYGGGCGCRTCCGRKKRGIPDNFNKKMLEHYHMKIVTADKDQCGLRLVCELAQKDEAKLTGKEKLVLLPYRGSGASDGTNYGLYDEAAWHGSEGRECHLLYPLCSFAAHHIMDRAQNLPQNSENDFI